MSACLGNNRRLDAIRSSGILISRRGRIGFRSRIRSSSFRCCLRWNILNLEGKLIVVDGYSALTCVKNVVECKKTIYFIWKFSFLGIGGIGVDVIKCLKRFQESKTNI